jgi:hypothetical protein
MQVCHFADIQTVLPNTAFGLLMAHKEEGRKARAY